MTNQGTFELECIDCKSNVVFSILELDKEPHVVKCPSCNKKYAFGHESLMRQIKKFAALVRQIQDSQEILGDASIAVDVGGQSVQVPFKLLLTRLKSVLNLQIGEKSIQLAFRVEPTTLSKV